MAITKNLNTRLKLRYDSHENWITNDPVLLAGEVALSTVTVKQNGIVNSVPSVLIKVGDGTHKYSELDFAFARAADVLEQAKDAEKLTAFINNVIAEAGIATDEALSTLAGRVTTVEGAITTLNADASTTGSVAKKIADAIAALDLANTYAAKTHSHAISDVTGLSDSIADAKKAGADANSALEAYKTSNDAALAGVKATAEAAYVKPAAGIAKADLASDVQASLGKADTALQEHQDISHLASKTEAQGYATSAKNAVIGYDSDNEDSNTVKGAKKYADSLNTAMDTRMDAAEASITTLTGADTVEGSVAKALKDAKAYADGKDTAIAAAKNAADAAQADVDALEAKVGTVEEGKTVVQMISEAKEAATYDDTALANRVTTVEGKVTTLIGDDASKSARTIASEEVAKIVAGADASFDTLKEIADWISSHKTDATAMNSAIVKLEAIVDGIGGDGEKATVVEYVIDAIAALKIGDYAKAADLTALAGRVTTLEGKAHEHANKALLDTYTQTEVDLADAVAKKHEHANKEELDKIASGDKAKWDAAVQTVTAGTGLTATKTGTDVAVGIDDNVVFVLDCGSSSVNI